MAAWTAIFLDPKLERVEQPTQPVSRPEAFINIPRLRPLPVDFWDVDDPGYQRQQPASCCIWTDQYEVISVDATRQVIVYRRRDEDEAMREAARRQD